MVCILFLGPGRWLVVLVPATGKSLLPSCVVHSCLKATHCLLTMGSPNRRAASTSHIDFQEGNMAVPGL